MSAIRKSDVGVGSSKCRNAELRMEKERKFLSNLRLFGSFDGCTEHVNLTVDGYAIPKSLPSFVRLYSKSEELRAAVEIVDGNDLAVSVDAVVAALDTIKSCEKNIKRFS